MGGAPAHRGINLAQCAPNTKDRFSQNRPNQPIEPEFAYLAECVELCDCNAYKDSAYWRGWGWKAIAPRWADQGIAPPHGGFGPI
jgi:hypothetical protein